MFIFDFEIADREQDHKRRGGQKQRAEENKEGINDDGIGKTGHALGMHAAEPIGLHPERIAAEGHAGHGSECVHPFLLLGKKKIGEQNAQAPQGQLHFRQNHPKIASRWRKEAVHGLGLPVRGVRGRDGNNAHRGWRNRRLRLVITGIDLLHQAPHGRVEDAEKRLRIEADPESQGHEWK